MLKETELAVSIEIQQAASLQGISSAVLMSTGHHKLLRFQRRLIRNIANKTRVLVISALGNDAGWELLKSNRESVLQYLQGIKNDPRLTKKESTKVFNLAVEDLIQSCIKGSKLVI